MNQSPPHRLQPILVLAAMGLGVSALLAVAWPDSGRAPVVEVARAHVVVGTRAASAPVTITSRPTPAGTDTAAQALRYGFAADDLPTFAVSVEQTMTARDAGIESQVVTTLVAQVKVEPGTADDLVYFLFESFDLSVTADGEDVVIPAVSSLLRGIRVQVTVDGQAGLVDDATLAGVNPQVRRMLALLMDALRQAHPPLPSEAVAVGTTWQHESLWESDDDGHLEARLQVDLAFAATSTPSEAVLSGRTTLVMDGAHADDAVVGTGSGQVDVRLDSVRGRVLQSEGTFVYRQRVAIAAADGELGQELALKFSVSTL